MVDAFEAISFLTRSENRVDVLECLAGGPHTERELVAETGVSDVTVGRVLEDFEERGWVVETDDGYRRTRIGDMLAEDYSRLHDSMDLACRLGPVRDLFPVEEFSFDLRLLTDARVSAPDGFDPLRAVDRWKELLRGADRFVGVAPAATGTTVVAEPFHEEITEHGLEFSAVVSQQYYETVTSRAETRRLVREELAAGAEMYLAADETEFQVSVAAFDDVATISAYDDAGNLRAGIESRAPPVHEWVLDTYETHREDATRLTPEDFAD
jgi:predicted transcriptional regulator